MTQPPSPFSQQSSSSASAASSCCCPCRRVQKSSSGGPNNATDSTISVSSSSSASFNAKRINTTSSSSSSHHHQGKTVLCSACVGRFLQSARQRRQEAWEERCALQRQCREKFAEYHQDDNDNALEKNTSLEEARAEETAAANRLWQMQQQDWQHEWLPQWERLRQESSRVAVQVARLKFHNEQRQDAIQVLAQETYAKRQLLYRWKRALLAVQPQPRDEEAQEENEDDPSSTLTTTLNRGEENLGAMATAVMAARQQVRRLRFQWALHAFAMHRIHVGGGDNNNTSTNNNNKKNVRGIGKIGGCLPLPHAGPELYVFLPPHELQSALRLVASLTALVAACLGILLPHPILLLQQQQQQQQAQDETTPSTTNTTKKKKSALPPPGFQYCRDLAMRGGAAAADEEQQHNRDQQADDNWQEPILPSAAAADTTETTKNNYGAASSNNSSTSTATTATTTAAITASNLLSLAGQTFRRATSGAVTSNAATSASKAAEAARNTAPKNKNKNASNKTNVSTTRRQPARKPAPSTPLPSMDPASVQRRIHHATAAVLAENEHGSLYTLAAAPLFRHPGLQTTNANEISGSDTNPTATSTMTTTIVIDPDHFAIALQLLQNDVIALCIRAGVPVTNLWPAQAVLLNLQALQEFCQEQTIIKV